MSSRIPSAPVLIRVQQSGSNNSPGSFAQSRIVHVEKYFGLLCSSFSSFVRKNARLRDKGDLIAQNLKAYAENETINNTTKYTLLQIAANFSAVQDYKQAQIIRLEDKVVKPLSDYGTKCRQMKNVIKNQQTKRAKHIKEQNRLEKLKQKTTTSSTDNRLAETDEMRAAQDVAHSTIDLEQKIDGFEKEKIVDLKSVLCNFMQIQMVYHAKALELYSKCYENLTLYDEYKDLEDFRVVLKESSGVPKFNLANSMALGSTGQSQTFPSGTYMTPRSTMSSEPRTVRINPNHTNMFGYDYDDDEDDDDDDDDLDDYPSRR